MSDIIVWVDKINNRKQFAGWRYSYECVHEDHDNILNISISSKGFRQTRQYSYIPTGDVATISIVDKVTGKTLDVLHSRGPCYRKPTRSVCYDCAFSGNNKDKPKGLGLAYKQICRRCIPSISTGGFRPIEEVLEDL